MFRAFFFFTVVFFLLQITANAQQSTHEIGVQIVDITKLSSNFIYKKRIKDNVYRRYNFDINHLSLGAKNSNLNTNSFIFNASIGTEKRKNIRERFNFVYGLQYRLGFDLQFSNTLIQANNGALIQYSKQEINTELGIGYLLGVKYDIAPYLYASIETMPTISAIYDRGRNKTELGVTANTDIFGIKSLWANIAVVSVVYTFDFHKE
jgi:hypothetical protein